jgi:hypothetical protein
MSNLERIYEILFVSKIEKEELIEKKRGNGKKNWQPRLNTVLRKIEIAEKLIKERLTKRGILTKYMVNVMGTEMTFYKTVKEKK